jgi:S1-C subfamily serine protease
MLVLAVLPPGGGQAVVAKLKLRDLTKEMDLAIIEASPEAAAVPPVTFAPRDVLPIGAAVAATGFPIPDLPILDPSKGVGQLLISRRLATGYVSNYAAEGKTNDWPFVPDTLYHYETNMLTYGGISGGPVFDFNGRVVGLHRGGRTHEECGSRVGSSPPQS